MAGVDKVRTAEAVATLFPFKEFFSDAPQPLFQGASYEQVREERGEAVPVLSLRAAAALAGRQLRTGEDKDWRCLSS